MASDKKPVKEDSPEVVGVTLTAGEWSRMRDQLMDLGKLRRELSALKLQKAHPILMDGLHGIHCTVCGTAVVYVPDDLMKYHSSDQRCPPCAHIMSTLVRECVTQADDARD